VTHPNNFGRGEEKLFTMHPQLTPLYLQIEAAYDVLFMQSMKNRLGGSTRVGDNIKFADVPPPASEQAKAQLANTLSQLPGGGVRMSSLSGNDATLMNVVFAAILFWSVAQGATVVMPTDQAPGGQLAFALAAAVYFQSQRKRNDIGRSVGISGAAFVAGLLLGTGIEAWLRVDIVPLGPFASPSCLVGDFGVAAVWAATALLA